MESTAFFEKKISLTPSDFNEVKTSSIESLLSRKATELMESKCSEQGFVLPGSIKLLSRSMGYFESARFTGDAVYYVKLEGKVIYPADGVRVIGEVIRKNKMGLYVIYKDAIRVLVPRDLHIGNEEFEDIKVGDNIEFEVMGAQFKQQDKDIVVLGKLVSKVKEEQVEESTEKLIEIPTQLLDPDVKNIVTEPEKPKRKLKLTQPESSKINELVSANKEGET
jgi:hypothetical protein